MRFLRSIPAALAFLALGAHLLRAGAIFALAVPVAIAATLIGQLSSPLGFGRSTGLRSAVGGAALGLIVVVVAAYSI